MKKSCVSEENVAFVQNEHVDTMPKLAETTDVLKHQTQDSHLPSYRPDEPEEIHPISSASVRTSCFT